MKDARKRQWVNSKTSAVDVSGSVMGWFDYYQLYNEAACRYPAGSHFVEVGAFLGLSSVHMAFAILTTGKTITFDVVDTFRGEGTEKTLELAAKQPDGTFRNLFDYNVIRCRMSGLIGVHQMLSVEAAELYDDESLQFVFIDGDHNRDAVAADIAAWRPKIAPEGCLAGHDVDREGVKWAVWNAFTPKDDVRIIPEVRSWRWHNAVPDLSEGSEVGRGEEGREGHRDAPVEGQSCRPAAGVVRS